MFSHEVRALIRQESGCADTTIRCSPAVREASRRRIERACGVLGIAIPGAATSSTPDPAPKAV